MKVDFNEGDSGQGGAGAGRDRSAALSGSARAGPEHAGARPGAARATPRSTSSATQKLLATDAIPKQQLDTQNALVAQYEATIKQDTANIDNAKLQLTYAKVTAPITGVVGLRLVDPGNIVHASDATGMVVITQLQPISVLFTIPEDSLPQVNAEAARRARISGRGLQPRQLEEAGVRDAGDRRQPDRQHHRHLEAEGGVRQQGQRALPAAVRQHAPAGGLADQSARRPERRRPEWPAGHLRLRRGSTIPRCT